MEWKKIQIVEPNFKIITPIEWIKEYPSIIERCGRTCYQSFDFKSPNSEKQFTEKIVKSGHLSVIEHLNITVSIIGDRSMSHQLVRHRLASYSQESQRYVNYQKKGYKIICPESIGITKSNIDEIKKYESKLIDREQYKQFIWLKNINESLNTYETLLKNEVKKEDARTVLPNAMKTEVVTTFNLRTWMHVFNERALNKHAQNQIKKIMQNILIDFNKLIPEVFNEQYEKLQEILKDEK